MGENISGGDFTGSEYLDKTYALKASKRKILHQIERVFLRESRSGDVFS
jgi:hypothetical protein